MLNFTFQMTPDTIGKLIANQITISHSPVQTFQISSDPNME